VDHGWGAAKGEPTEHADGSPDFDGSHNREGRTRDNHPTPSNPRLAAASALTDAVVRALQGGDLVAAWAAARALSVLVDALTAVSEPASSETVQDLGSARNRRGGVIN